MFENDYTFSGRHATYIKFLVNNAKLFSRYIDVYMSGAIWGLLYGRLAKNDPSEDRARIYADAFANERDNCVFLYRLVMLLGGTTDLSSTERVDRAFRYDSQPEKADLFRDNMTLFHDYVRGGVEAMYEQLTDGCISQEDYITRTYEVMTDFKKELEGISYTNEIARILKG